MMQIKFNTKHAIGLAKSYTLKNPEPEKVFDEID
jgi:hypothetical protein